MTLAAFKNLKKASLTTLKFDYKATEDLQTRKEAQAATLRIRDNLEQSKEAFFQIGCDLLGMKDGIMHGGFQDWLSTEFPSLKYRTAVNYMRAYILYIENPEAVKQLDITAVYELSSKSTPHEVKEEFLQQAAAGTVPTVKEAKQAAQPEAKKPDLKVIECTPIDGRKQAAADALELLEKHLEPDLLKEFATLAVRAEHELLPILAHKIEKEAEAA